MGRTIVAESYDLVSNGVSTGPKQLLTAWNIRETAGAVATVRLRKGSVTGQILVTLRLAANESAGDELKHPRMLDNQAVYMQVVAGTVEGVVAGA